MYFTKVNKADKEMLKIFIPCRKNFIYSGKSAIKQLSKIIHTSEMFYRVTDEYGILKGCLFVDFIDHENKIIEFGGFAQRHAPTKTAVKELMAYLKHYYPDYKIRAITTQLTAKISLVRAGLIKGKEGYIYE